MWSTPEVAILWETSGQPDPEIENVARALETQVREHFAPVWGRDARVRYVPEGTWLDPDSWWLVVAGDAAEAADRGFNDLTYMGLPSATVHLDAPEMPGYGWPQRASAALLNMLADPFSSYMAFQRDWHVSLGAPDEPVRLQVPESQRVRHAIGPLASVTAPAAERPTRDQTRRIMSALSRRRHVEPTDWRRRLEPSQPVLDRALREKQTDEQFLADIDARSTNPMTAYAWEVCDPVGADGYEVEVCGTCGGGSARVTVSNFVHPAWFSRYGEGWLPHTRKAETGETILRGRFDHLRTMGRPFQQKAPVGVLDMNGTATWMLRPPDGGTLSPVDPSSRLARRNRPLRLYSFDDGIHYNGTTMRGFA